MRLEEQVRIFVKLEPAGKKLRGLSPFTREQSPSFYIDPSTQTWHDFSSGLSGDAAAFLKTMADYRVQL